MKKEKAMELLNIEPSEIIPYKMNAKKHPPEQIQQIKESIKEYGFLSPLLIDKKNNLICGHGRLIAAEQLELHTVPCLRVEHLTEAQRRAFVHVENRLQESGGASWDTEILKAELDDLMLNLNVGLEHVGFSPDEITSLLAVPSIPFEPDMPEDDNNNKERSLKIVITCRDNSEHQDHFDELNSRGFKVKAG
jgi:ParB/RepB/Spo0J family partition protein